ncbi:ABC transporter transmembrane domain-containing protein [Loktanella sp. Alg231-35]|uniref:ABC transporter transmembrane domain-containing protein n=1 Tax=Loktanella sp. Alg231-35 TaxID=1922220 RepID=UPI000D55AB6E|nr:ABC transporter transmembrane domain-containing protein [Loktanella sp. Alg231-35]
MKQLPVLLKDDRVFDAVTLPFLGILQALFLGVGVFATREAFAAIHVGEDLAGWTMIKLIGVGIAVSCLEVLIRTTSERIGQSYANSLRITLYAHLAGMRYSELQRRRLGALSLRFVGDLTAARNWFGQGMPRVIAAAFILPGAGFTLWLLDPQIAKVSVSILVITMLAMAAAAYGFDILHQTLRGRRANISIAMIERIAVAPLLDLMGRTTKELDALNAQGQQLRVDATARAWRAGTLTTIPQLGLALAGVGTLWIATTSQLPTGTVAAALSMLAILALPLRDLAQAWDQFSAWRIARDKALRLLSNNSKLRRTKRWGAPVSVEIEDAQSTRLPAISIAAGTTVELSGGDLSERSRLARAIAGLDDPKGWTILYDGQCKYIPRIGFVDKTPLAIQGSLRRVLTLGSPRRPKDDAILRMAKHFGLSDLLSRDADALMTRISEGAHNVNTAQGLRIDLTRVALSKPDLIVVDTARLAGEPDAMLLIDQLRTVVESTIIIIGRRATQRPDIHFVVIPPGRSAA